MLYMIVCISLLVIGFISIILLFKFKNNDNIISSLILIMLLSVIISICLSSCAGIARYGHSRCIDEFKVVKCDLNNRFYLKMPFTKYNECKHYDYEKRLEWNTYIKKYQTLNKNIWFDGIIPDEIDNIELIK